MWQDKPDGNRWRGRRKWGKKECNDKGLDWWTNETEAGHIADHTEADSEKQDIPHEWPYSSEPFEA